MDLVSALKDLVKRHPGLYRFSLAVLSPVLT